MDYKKWKNAFVRISDVTDPKRLDKDLPGRLKYDPRTREPLPFEGASVIHNIDQKTATRLGLSTIANQVISQMTDAGLDAKIAFVSTESFHATTFDLINRADHAEKLSNAGKDYSVVRLEVENETRRLLTESNLRLSAPARITGLGMFAPRVLKLNLEFSDLVLKTFHGYRVALHRHLIERVLDYRFVRGPYWEGKLAGHITLGYVVNPLGHLDEINEFVRIMKSFNDDFQPLTFEITQGEVTQFTDMDSYSVVTE